MNSNKQSRRAMIILGIAILAALIVVIIMQGMLLSKDAIGGNTGDQGLSAADKSVLTQVKTSIDNLRQYSFYTDVQTSEDTVVSYVYNNNGEALSQEVYDKAVDDAGETVEGMNTIVYMNNGTSVEFDEYISYTDTIDVMKLLELAEQTAEDGLGVITVNKNPDIDNPDGEYIEVNIDIRSYLNISHMYSKVSDLYAYNEVEALRNLVARLKEIDQSIDDEHVNLRFVYLIDTNLEELQAASCWMYFGTEESSKVTYNSDTELTAQWIMVDRHITDDWKLEDSWYTTDWDTIDTWEDLTPAEDMLTTEYEKIMVVLKSHYGIEPEDTETTETEEPNKEVDASTTDTDTTDINEADTNAVNEEASGN